MLFRSHRLNSNRGKPEPAMEIADWPTKRAWVQYAYDTMTAAGTFPAGIDVNRTCTSPLTSPTSEGALPL